MKSSLAADRQSSQRISMEHRRSLAATCFAFTGIAAMAVMALTNRSTWSVDFAQFYTAGSLVGTGHLFDWPTLQALELKHVTTAVPYIRLPFYALVFKTLSSLPYLYARLLFLIIEIAAMAGFVALWPFSRRRWAWVAACWCTPAAICLAFGQDSVLFLFFVALGFRLLLPAPASPSADCPAGRRDFWAGVALSVCAAKPHLALLLPVVLVAQNRWKALLGGACGGIAIVALSFAAEGAGWPARYMALARLPDFEHAVDRMPNLRGLLSFFGASLTVEFVLAALVALGVFVASRRIPLKHGMALALAGGLLLSHHSYVYDCVLLLPALMLPFEESYPEWVRMWALLLLTPLPYMLILGDRELPGHLAVTGYSLALLLTMLWGLRHTEGESLQLSL